MKTKQSKIVAILCLCVSLFTVNQVNATNEKFINQIQCSQIDAATNLVLLDSRYNRLYNANWPNEFKHVSNNNRVSLKVDFNQGPNYYAAYTYSADLQITYEDENLNQVIKYVTLYVDYTPNAGAVKTDESSYAFQGAHKIDVQVLAINTSHPGGSTPCNVFLEAEMDIDRIYSQNENSLITTFPVKTSYNYFQMSWVDSILPEYYELEWTWVDNYLKGGGLLAASSIQYDFSSDASRVDLKDYSFEFPLLYSRGYILYRIRRVYRSFDNPEQYVWGQWQGGAESGTVNNYPSKYEILTAHHSGEINYSMSLSFAEDGKMAESVVYADGLGKGRQTVVKSKEQGTSLVGETYYDHYGRPALNVLPAPTYSSEMKFYDLFNRDTSAGEITPLDFDLDNTDTTAACMPTATILDTNYGASNYYSTANSRQNFQQAFLPDAKGYPYSRIYYTNDNTGRVAKKTLAGEDFRPGNGKEIHLKYSAGNYMKMKKLFGSDVGLARGYFESSTIDPNGQISSTYKDLRGNVIMTSIDGDAPTGMKALSSNYTTTDTVDLLANNDMSMKILSPNDTRESSYGFLARKNDNYTLNYGFKKGQVTDTCLPTDYCYDCEYILKVSVLDECGEEVIPGGAILDTLSQEPYDSICAPDSTIKFDTTITLAFDKGVQYHIAKELTINPASIDAYAERYLEESTCIKPYQHFFDLIFNKANFSGCTYQICDLVCAQKYGIRDSAGADTLKYDTLISKCLIDCQYPDDCSILLGNILSDMMPGGQYAKYNDSGLINPSSFPLSIFNTSNQLPGAPNWRNVTFAGRDSIADSTYNIRGEKVPVNDTSISLREFIKIFDDDWADSLAPYHPEWCYWVWCDSQKVSYTYDRDIFTINYFDSANTLGYMNPLNDTHSIVPTGILKALPDSFFIIGAGAPDSLKMKDSLRYFLPVGGMWFSIWDIAVVQMNCPNAETKTEIENCLVNHSFGENCFKDAHWRAFRSLYFDRKREIVDRLITTHAMVNDCYNGCIGVEAGSWNPKENDFDCYPIIKSPICGSVYDADADGNQYCNNSTRSLYENKVKWYDLITDTIVGGRTQAAKDSFKLIADSISMVQCKTSCETRAIQWMMNLSLCGLDPTDSLEMAEDLVEICKWGCDSSRFNGSSNLPPGYTTTNSGKTNFEEVINFYITKSDSCSYYLIDPPTTFYDTILERSYNLDTCGCTKILNVKNRFSTGNYPNAQTKTVTQLWDSLYGYEFPNLNLFECVCEDAFLAGGVGAWSPGDAWESGSVDHLDSAKIMAPIDMLCPKCINCDELDGYMLALKMVEGVDTTSRHYFEILAKFVNKNSGFNHSAGRYEQFYRQCILNSSPGGAQCSKLTTEGRELQRFLKQIGGTSNWYAVAAVVDVPGNPAFNWVANSKLAKKVVDFSYFWSCYTYNEFITGNGTYHCNDSLHVLRFGHDGVDKCRLDMRLPNAWAKPYKVSDLVSVDALVPFGGACSGTTSFYLLSTFVDSKKNFYSDTLIIDSSCVTVANDCCNYGTLCDIDTSAYQPPDTSDCVKKLMKKIKSSANKLYRNYLDSVRASIRPMLIEKCINAVDSEYFDMRFPGTETHYTLYYYDQANNLVRTVPPAGVDYGNPTSHTMVTDYRYNSYNQVVEQKTPDAGKSNYWYDLAGRLVVSQNSSQAYPVKKYSYTLYDEHGRVNEVGQLHTSAAITDATSGDPALLSTWLAGATVKEQLTRTFYDDVLSETINSKFENGQQFLRNRVATVATYDTVPVHDTLYQSAIHYSYDAHGNVIENINDLPDLEQQQQRFKSVNYSFDLVSGNVNRVAYQKGYKDGFEHGYEYDAYNRLVRVNTSRDGVNWRNDARYHYYDHGPLARVELGHADLQGMDYAYTINGWLKNVNSNALKADHDPGRDAYIQASPHMGASRAHYTPDVMGYSLGYFDGDYSAVSNNSIAATNRHLASISTGFGSSGANDYLYNGNISSMITSLDNKTIHGNSFKYDQLNRLVESEVYTTLDTGTNQWGSGAATTDYAAYYFYDANGNIDSLSRNGISGTQTAMDQMKYHYVGGSNRLHRVVDAASDHASYDDIKQGQITNNYTYNSDGSLFYDTQEKLGFYWNVYGKIAQINSNDISGSLDLIDFKYNALGQRVMKKVKYFTGDADYTYYSYDASGNLLATYSRSVIGTTQENIRLAEHNLYGSSRLGSDNLNTLLYKKDIPNTIDTAYLYNDSLSYLGSLRNYEMTNHLGNVLTTISDRKLSKGTPLYIKSFTGSLDGMSACGNSTIVSSGGKLKVTVTSASTNNCTYMSFSVVAGTTYRFEIDFEAGSISNVEFDIYGALTVALTSGTNIIDYIPTTSGTIYPMVRPAGGGGTAGYYYIDNWKVIEEPGFIVDITSQTDYYPYGSPKPGRQLNPSDYKFGYQGSEKDNEVKGTGNHYSTYFRQLDPRLGRWLSLDPITHPWQSSYCSMDNNPISYNDKMGDNTIARDPDPDAGGDFGAPSEKRLAPKESAGTQHSGTHTSHDVNNNHLERATKSITVTTTESGRYGGTTSNTSTIKGSASNVKNVSDRSARVIVESMKKARVSEVRITSTQRSPEKQASIMYDNAIKDGAASQYRLYARSGDKIVRVFESYSPSWNCTKSEAVAAMVERMYEIGPHKVSNHVANPAHLNVIDLSRNSISVSLRKPFHYSLLNNIDVSKLLSPYNSSDRAFHIEIKQ